MYTRGYTHNKEAILKRLKRAEGQIRGISGMVEKDIYCIDVLTQINAVRGALDTVAVELLRDHAHHCMTDPQLSPEDTRKKADELVAAVGRML